MKNWESDNPRPVHKGTIGVVNMTMQHWTSIIVIPGVNLVLSYTGSTLGCWDILACRCVATLEIWNLQLEGQNACMDVKGEALIGGCIGYVFKLSPFVC